MQTFSDLSWSFFTQLIQDTIYMVHYRILWVSCKCRVYLSEGFIIVIIIAL